MLSRRVRILAFPVFLALLIAWGYWYAWNHAAVFVYVHDSALKPDGGPWGARHGVTLAFRDSGHAPLANARSVEPSGIIFPIHPSAEIGNCQHAALRPPAGNAGPGDYEACYKRYSAWSATWATRVQSADVSVGSCELRDVPGTVRRSNQDWLLWWVPLVHIGGFPFQHVELTVAFDSRACSAVRPDR